MTGWIVFGAFVLAICISMVVLSRRAARRRAGRAAYAHSEPGGPHHNDDALRIAALGLARDHGAGVSGGSDGGY